MEEKLKGIQKIDITQKQATDNTEGTKTVDENDRGDLGRIEVVEMAAFRGDRAAQTNRP